ncbi:hypothetical protein ACQJBY_035710 [Aegilops geniculata]
MHGGFSYLHGGWVDACRWATSSAPGSRGVRGWRRRWRCGARRAWAWRTWRGRRRSARSGCRCSRGSRRWCCWRRRRCRCWGSASWATARRPRGAACCAARPGPPWAPASTCSPSTSSARPWRCCWRSGTGRCPGSAGCGTGCCPRRPPAWPWCWSPSCGAPTGASRPCARGS